MSVIVKGICKPINCINCDSTYYRCPLLDYTDDCKLQDCDPDWSWEEQYKGCPLIEIPEGARLIDGNALVDSLGISDRDDYCEEIIDEAPTVFEED